jgi:hypothetical protein
VAREDGVDDLRDDGVFVADDAGEEKRLIIRGITVIDGTGAAPEGPMDVVIEGNRIVDVVSVGVPHRPIKEKGRPVKGDREIDGTGKYLMPGFVDTHVHYGSPDKAPDAEYVNKLWLASGVTTVRGVPGGGLDWTLNERERSARNEITAPRIFVYQPAFTGDGWKDKPEKTPGLGREWVRFLAGKGADGIKLFGGDPDVVAAILDEGRKYKLGSLAHLGQESESRLTAIDATRLGLRTVTHSYGLFESMLTDTTVQDYPADQNYNDEQMRFGQVARNWDKIAPRGSTQWNGLIDEWVKGGTVLNPTFTIYSAGRDLMRAYTAEWHDKYTLPSLMQYYQPNRENHGSFFYNWTTEDEVASSSCCAGTPGCSASSPACPSAAPSPPPATADSAPCAESSPLQVFLRDQQLFLTRAGALNVDRREDTLVDQLAVEDDFHVARALELFEDDLVHARAGIDQRRRNDRQLNRPLRCCAPRRRTASAFAARSNPHRLRAPCPKAARSCCTHAPDA